MVDPVIKRKAEQWAADDIDADAVGELHSLLEGDNAAEVIDRMAGPLAFGTAGLRGILGAGPNRMNRAVVVRTTAGLAHYLVEQFPDAATRGVVVGHDARRMSREFAEEAARVLVGAGLVAHVFPGLATTPQTAFATTALGAVAGIMITASHNPPEYNGYKVYWSNGAQIIPPHDAGISRAIDAVGPARNVPRPSEQQAREAGLWHDVDDAVTGDYLAQLGRLSLRTGGREGLRIVYTPMHGVGRDTAVAAFSQAGFHDVIVVPEQAEPDGSFPTVKFPNPEEPGAMDLAYATARASSASIVLANDPDADRLAVAVPSGKSDAWVQLSGNQIGVLLAHYRMTQDPRPVHDRLVVTTIVSSPMMGAIAAALGVRYDETLTGFKWIANRAMQVERETGTTFVFGYEEALGYTVGTVVRDKDGVGAAAVFAELAATLAAEGISVLEQLDRLYRQYGLFLSKQVSHWHRGLDGEARIAELMARLRSAPPKCIGEHAVLSVRDYLRRVRVRADGTTEPLTLPTSNVLAFDLAGGSRVVARPSGTEPKIKFYVDYREQVQEGETMDAAHRRAAARMDDLTAAFLATVA